MINFIPSRDANGNIINEVHTRAFADKIIDGYKLYRRKHGLELDLSSGSEVLFNIPYPMCKINEVEIVNGANGDKIDFIVTDTPAGTISTVPNLGLNQFGYSVRLPDGLYRDVSQYDADLIQDMKIKIKYTSTRTDKIYFNIVLHEMKL